MLAEGMPLARFSFCSMLLTEHSCSALSIVWAWELTAGCQSFPGSLYQQLEQVRCRAA